MQSPTLRPMPEAGHAREMMRDHATDMATIERQAALRFAARHTPAPVQPDNKGA